MRAVSFETRYHRAQVNGRAIWRPDSPCFGILIRSDHYDHDELLWFDSDAWSVDLAINVHLVVFSLQLSFTYNHPR